MLGYHSVAYYLAVALVEMVGLDTFVQQWKRPIMAAIAWLTGAGCSPSIPSSCRCVTITRPTLHGELRAVAEAFHFTVLHVTSPCSTPLAPAADAVRHVVTLCSRAHSKTCPDQDWEQLRRQPTEALISMRSRYRLIMV